MTAHLSLSKRQLQVFILRGQCNKRKVIARKLGISAHTVNVHLRNIHEITGLRTSERIVQYVTKLEMSYD